jgi:hypothetical protein
MGRRHHVKDMLYVCETIAKKIPHASVGSDIIVGFPGETPERFEATYDTLKNTYMNYFHVFSYSKRKGTPAASFEDQVPEREKKGRAQRLRELSDTKNLAYRERFLGKTLEIIVEEGGEQGMSESAIRAQRFKYSAQRPGSSAREQYQPGCNRGANFKGLDNGHTSSSESFPIKCNTNISHSWDCPLECEKGKFIARLSCAFSNKFPNCRDCQFLLESFQ